MVLQKRVSAAILGAILALLTLAACGNDEAGTGSNGRATPPQDTSKATSKLQPQPEVNQDLDANVTIAEGGTIEVGIKEVRFAPNRLGVTLGQEVTIRVTNDDGVPHTLRIAGIDGKYDTEDDAVTDPATIGAGQTGELTGFTPTVAGKYSFRCDFHPGQMGGQIEVD